MPYTDNTAVRTKDKTDFIGLFNCAVTSFSKYDIL